MKIKFFFLTIILIISCLTAVNSEELFKVEAKKVNYEDNSKKIIATGDAFATDGYKKIYADKIIYYKNLNLIKTDGNSKFENINTILNADTFEYNLNSKIIKAYGNVKFLDNDKNIFYFKNFTYNEIGKTGTGNELKSNFKDGSYLQAKKGQIDNNKNLVHLNKADYTTCKKIKDTKGNFCPSWSLSSKEMVYDKKNQIVKHKNSILKIKRLPILYSPYFSHPDPSVKRKSGFLPPAIRTLSSIGKTLKVPYFWEIDKDKDLTITPIYYFNENHIINASYRQIFKDSFLNLETSYSKGYKNYNKSGRTKGSKNYIFLNLDQNRENLFYKSNKINFKIQRISQKNYVRVNKLKTNLFNEDIRTLENSFSIASYDDNKRLEIKSGIFENLDSENDTKYTYYLPDGIFSYNKNNFKNFNLNFNSTFQGQKYSKNTKQGKIRNNISLKSKTKNIRKFGIASDLNLNLLNNNIYNNNLASQKGGLNSDNYFTLALNNKLPFAKLYKNTYETITPRLYLKYTNGKMLNARSNDKSLNYSDIFIINRTNNSDTPETGLSAGYGIDYEKNKNKLDNIDTLYNTRFGFGQILKKKHEYNMPLSSSLNKKSSDFAGYLEFNLYGKKNKINEVEISEKNYLSSFNNDYLGISYNFNIDDSLQRFNRNNLQISGTYNKYYFGINFNEKNNYVGDERNGLINFKKMINNNYYLNFEGKRNLREGISEYHRFSLNYENDCIITSLSISKDFYVDDDLKNSKTLIFGITLKPFSDSLSPDLTNFIK